MLMVDSKISAKVLQHTKHFISKKEMISMELEMPRSLLAELNTHKILVRNAQSSRAVPIKNIIENLKNGISVFMPTYWGKNQSGMSASVENNNLIYITEDVAIPRERAWKDVMMTVIYFAEKFMTAEYHKQIIGRLLEPFMMVKVILSGTEWDNFYNLRIHPSAEPHFRDLAIKIYEAIRESKPLVLGAGEYHLPYIKYERDEQGVIVYKDSHGKVLDLDTAISISLSCIAQTSYRKTDDSIEKAQVVIDKLFNGDVVHASPAEHIATPMTSLNSLSTAKTPIGYEFNLKSPEVWEKGITHVDKYCNFWSGQLKHFIQYRQLLPNNVCNNFTHEKFLEYTKDPII